MPRLGLGSKIREPLVTYRLGMVERPPKRPFDQAFNYAGGVVYIGPLHHITGCLNAWSVFSVCVSR
jgi:hypothetical protein